MHIPFVGMVKFKFLAHFPVDHLAHPVMSTLVLLLCQYIIVIIIIITMIITFFIPVVTSFSLLQDTQGRLRPSESGLC